MNEIWIAFITGLTAGGLSCMAVQGGLLASSLASQVELDVQAQSDRRRKARSARGKPRPRLALPITIFLIAKLIAYTILGFLLGLLGQSLSLTPMMRALLQFAIGIFMIGNGLRMLNVHPIFRYFNFEPPYAVRRWIRQTSKSDASLASPILLGAMTVLIPCGITQSFMAVALGTANPLIGAAILAAFTIGGSPVFFALSYGAAKLGSVLEKYFLRIVAVVLLLLGFFAIDTGLNIAGSPYSVTSAIQGLLVSNETPAGADTAAPVPTSATSSDGTITLVARNSGYQPRTLQAKANQPFKLQVVTLNTTSCALAFTIPELNVARELPTTGQVLIDIPAQPAGKVMRFSCSMGMYTGQIVFQ